MRLPVEWLKRYVPVAMTAEKLSEALTLSGTKVESVDAHGADTVIHIEVTTNRPDCLSIWGLANEVAALTGKRVKLPKLSVPSRSKQRPSVKVVVEDRSGCPRYTARVLSGVTIQAAPIQAQKLIDAAGARCINNAVDATNFVLFETGQPLHAFDLDKLKGGVVTVRRARKGEKFLAIDGIEHTLDESVLVIADAERPVAMAGVMGGKHTEVTAETRNILLESAYFEPAVVRRAAKRYKISTESSYRFERGVNPELVTAASARARDLILEWAGGEEATSFIDIGGAGRQRPVVVKTSASDISKILGMAVPQSRMLSILGGLGIAASASGKDAFTVRPGAGRRDLTNTADIAEEVLRIVGFDKVKPAIPVTRHVGTVAADPKPAKIFELKKMLACQGFSEILTFSLVSEKALKDSGFTELGLAQKIRNPLSAAQEYMRPTLLPGMLEAILYNVHRKNDSLKFFEIGSRYFDGREQTVLMLAMTGALQENWLRKQECSYTDLKGAVQNVLGFFQIHSCEWSPPSADGSFAYASVASEQGTPLAKAGEVARAALTRWDIPKPVYAAEVLLDEAFSLYKEAPVPRAARLPKFPLVRRDIAFVVSEAIPYRDIESAIRDAIGAPLAGIGLFDEFKGKNIPAGKRSLALALSFRKEDGTFTDAEIGPLTARAADVIRQKFNAEIRA